MSVATRPIVSLVRQALAITLVCNLVGCATSEDVTDIHPFSSSLLQTCVTAWPVYLYKEDSGYGYHLFDSKYTYGSQPNVVVAEPEVSLPAGTILTVKRVNLESSMAGGPSIYISGTARAPTGAEYRVKTIVESVAAYREEWKKEHRFRVMPSTREYVMQSTESKPPWCEPPNVSPEHLRESRSPG